MAEVIESLDTGGILAVKWCRSDMQLPHCLTKWCVFPELACIFYSDGPPTCIYSSHQYIVHSN